VQLLGYADDINIMRRKKGRVYELCEKLKDRAKEAGLNITVKKTKAKVQNKYK
jgi:multimeric flavodoxin WrbA